MKISILLTFAFIATVSFDTSSAATNRIVCYLESWAYYREGNDIFDAKDIDAYGGCTHIVYTFFGLSEAGEVILMDSWLDEQLMGRLNNLKNTNADLKIMAAVGGWNEGSEKYSDAVTDSGKRSKFVSSGLGLLQKYKLDGLDIDWEYPAQRGGRASDKQNFVQLLKQFREAFNPQGLLLSVAVSALPETISYDVGQISNYVDYINVMTYDMHGSYDGVTGANSPLYMSDVDETGHLTVNNAIHRWIDTGADPQKINLGLPFYGHTFILQNQGNNKIGAPVSGDGMAGPITEEEGMMGYNEICVEVTSQNGWQITYDEKTRTPYASKGNQWISYDNPQSIQAKVQFAKDLNIGGVMIWSIDTDDYKSKCGPKNPLLNSIKSVLG